MPTGRLRARLPVQHRLAVAGVVVSASGAALWAALGVAVGEPIAPLFVPLAVAGSIVAVLAWRTPRALWLVVAGGPLVLAYFAADSGRLRHPDSFVEFVPSMLVVAGTVIAITSSLAALAARRRASRSAGGRRSLLAVGVCSAAVLALTAYSAVRTFGTATSVVEREGREAVVLTADRDRWVPDRLPVAAGAILARNPDWFGHTIEVPELGLDTYLAPRSERLIEVAGAPSGAYAFSCTVTGHEQMTGTLVVP